MPSISVPQKKRGRPATGETPRVGVRLPDEITAAIDTFAADQQPPLTRSEAVRTLVTEQLTTLGLLPHREDPEGAN